jgi:hypothetical protein
MEMKVLHFADVGEIQEAVTDELQKVQKEGFFGMFSEMYDRAKVCIYDNGDYFEFKNCRVFC